MDHDQTERYTLFYRYCTRCGVRFMFWAKTRNDYRICESCEAGEED
jgi:hypothetical protein